MEVLTSRMPNGLLQAIREIERDERAERAEVGTRLRDKAVHEWKLARALRMISEGRWTVRRAAKFAGLEYHEILERMSEQGIDSGPSVKDIREAFDRS